MVIIVAVRIKWDNVKYWVAFLSKCRLLLTSVSAGPLSLGVISFLTAVFRETKKLLWLKPWWELRILTWQTWPPRRFFLRQIHEPLQYCKVISLQLIKINGKKNHYSIKKLLEPHWRASMGWRRQEKLTVGLDFRFIQSPWEKLGSRWKTVSIASGRKWKLWSQKPCPGLPLWKQASGQNSGKDPGTGWGQETG